MDLMVRGFHCDAYGHVNNARYLEFYEEGRWAFLQPAVDENFFKNHNLMIVVVNINVSYKKPLLPDHLVEVVCDSIKFSNASMIISQRIIDKENSNLYSTADVTFVLLDRDSGRPIKVDDTIRTKFEELMNIQDA